MGLAQSTYQNAVGRGSVPRGELLEAAVRAFACNAHWLLTGEGPMWRTETGDVEGVRDEMQQQVARLQAELAARDREVERLEQHLQWAQRHADSLLQRAPAHGVAENGSPVLDGQPLSEDELEMVRRYRHATPQAREQASGVLERTKRR